MHIMYELTSPAVIKDIASRFGFTFSKGLGQNFLTDKNVLRTIAEAADAQNGVLEIGPGFGVLTQELALSSKKVVSIEIDKRLLPILDYTVGSFDNVKIINSDVIKTDLRKLIETEFNGEEISVAANLPYYITTPIITMLIEQKLPIKNIVVMVQKEVADRIAAAPGSKDYGAISVLCQYYTHPTVVTKVPAGAFVPPPKVDSAVLRLSVCDEPNVRVNDEKTFFKVVKAAFAQRRKTLLNCLANGSFGMSKQEISDMLEKIAIAPNVRGETLGLEEFARISDAFSAR